MQRQHYRPQKMRPEKFHYTLLEWDGSINTAAPPPPVMEIGNDVFRYRPAFNEIQKNGRAFTDVGPGCWPDELYRWAEEHRDEIPDADYPYYLLFARECLQYSRRYGLDYKFRKRKQHAKSKRSKAFKAIKHCWCWPVSRSVQ